MKADKWVFNLACPRLRAGSCFRDEVVREHELPDSSSSDAETLIDAVIDSLISKKKRP